VLVVFNATFNNISVLSWQSVLLAEDISRGSTFVFRIDICSFNQVRLTKTSYIEPLFKGLIYTGFQLIKGLIYTGFQFTKDLIYTGFQFTTGLIYTGFQFTKGLIYTGFQFTKGLTHTGFQFTIPLTAAVHTPKSHNNINT
jgi:hypothetical protein